MAKRRLISDELLYNDTFLDLSFMAFKLYVYALVESDADGIFQGLKKLFLNTQTEEKHLKELIDNNFVIQEPSKKTYAITHFHVMNTMEKNSGQNQNRYHATKHVTFKNQLFVTLDSTLTLDESEGFMPYSLYEGGSMEKVLKSYRDQLELENYNNGGQTSDGELNSKGEGVLEEYQRKWNK